MQVDPGAPAIAFKAKVSRPLPSYELAKRFAILAESLALD